MGSTTVLGRRADHRLALVLVVALLAPSLGPAAGYDMWAWFPDHGHAALGAVPGNHTHPWDAAPASGAAAEVEFTAGSLLGASILPVLLVAVALAPAMVSRVLAERRQQVPMATVPDVEGPPPR
ncbi:MAG: hypothetical protein AMXMBFR23_20830 [Chloroflexota bacterium]